MTKKDAAAEKPTEGADNRAMQVVSSKLTIKQLGDAKKFAKALPVDDKGAIFGYIYGRISGIKKALNADKIGTYNYLVGMFECEPSDKERSIMRSTKCTLPDGVMAQFAGLFRVTDETENAEDGKNKGAMYDFKIAVHVVNSPHGIKWAFQNVLAATEADTLKELRALGKPVA